MTEELTIPLTIPRRSSGVLLHPTSLPGPGIGDFGRAAYAFVDWLADAGQSYWQILPLVPIDAGGSPYNGLAALAGNSLLISAELLVDEGLVEPGLTGFEEEDAGRVDFGAVKQWKETLLVGAHRRFRAGAAAGLRDAFDSFCSANESWLPDYALFRALRDHFQEVPWFQWPVEIRSRVPEAVERWRSLLAEAVERYAFQQFLFHRQWGRLRNYAARRGVRIIGDLPIFVAHDSADVWANPEIFQLDELGNPTSVAGVPPDYFSATGQRWGNPLYRWEALKRNSYSWWVERFRRTLELVDVVRVDHFRGFQAYWAIPAAEETAVVGHWVLGPGAQFFRFVERTLGRLPVIAEDLGLITDEVRELCETLGYPGMRVLQFAFDGDPTNPHLPGRYPAHTVAYTGTHDNDTIAGWWSAVGGPEQERVREWMGIDQPNAWDFVHAVFDSAADLVVVPVQDLLGSGSEARMNVPGSIESNWTWRMRELPPASVAARLRKLTEETDRRTDDLDAMGPTRGDRSESEQGRRPDE